MKKFLSAVVGLCILSGVWYMHSLRPMDGGNTDRVVVSVKSGMSTTSIADLLKEKELIRSSLAFRLYVKFSGHDGTLQAGKFIMNKDQSVSELVADLQSGRGEEVSVTIPEGFTVKDIDALLTELEFIEAGELVDCANTCDFSTFDFLPTVDGLAERGGKLEGYLYPETYFVSAENFVPKFFLERLMNEFRINVLEGELSELIEESGRPLHDIITMASLIEEETVTDEERRVVSDILWKRFDDGRGLGVDATVRYILGKPTEVITHADLNSNSPYNTRKFRGLPPGPIANSGFKSIEATLTPKSSPYWYYLHDPDGQIHYARSNEEHNINRYYHLGSGRTE